MTDSSSSPRYRAYGLTFVCDFALPELPLAPDDCTPADIVIELGEVLSAEVIERALNPETQIADSIRFEADYCRILFTRVGRFTIRDGRHVLLEPVQSQAPDSWRLPLLGAAMAILLEQRGFFVLHAGAIDMGGFAASFLGHKGQGKSTLNAAWTLAGFPLLSDDVVALNWVDNPSNSSAQSISGAQSQKSGPVTAPGFAQIKLVPDAVRAILQSDPSHWPAVAPELLDVSKHAFNAPLATQPVPLRHLFVLTSLPERASGSRENLEDDVRLRRLAPQQAFAKLWPHTYGARFGDFYLKDERKKTHFEACARLVRECEVWELARRRDLSLLPATIQTIARTIGATPTLDARGLSGGAFANPIGQNPTTKSQ